MKKTKPTNKTAESEIHIALPVITEAKGSGRKRKKESEEESILSDAEFLKILMKPSCRRSLASSVLAA